MRINHKFKEDKPKLYDIIIFKLVQGRHTEYIMKMLFGLCCKQEVIVSGESSCSGPMTRHVSSEKRFAEIGKIIWKNFLQCIFCNFYPN